MIYVNNENKLAFDILYTKLLNEVLSKYNPSHEQIEAILLFAKIRHLLVHKGFPNPHLAPSKRERGIATGYSFNANEVQALADRLKSPKCFVGLKEKHLVAIKAISSFEKNLDHDFGFIRITKKKMANSIPL